MKKPIPPKGRIINYNKPDKLITYLFAGSVIIFFIGLIIIMIFT